MDRNDIEFYYSVSMPTSLQNLVTKISNEDFSFRFNEEDKKAIDRVWNEEVVKLNPKAFSKPNGLATLFDTMNGEYSFNRSEFKDYVAISRTGDKKTLTPSSYKDMRVAAVGAYLVMDDGSIFVHKRSEKATHAAGSYDSSCAGLCLVNEGKINPEKSLREKIKRELNLGESEFDIVGLVGIHSSYAPDFSGMFDIALKTSLSQKELSTRINPETFPSYEFVKREKLLDFIIEHYGVKKDMIGDGAATLIGALREDEFYYAGLELSNLGRRLAYGKLNNGEFISE